MSTKSKALQYLEKVSGVRLSLGAFIEAIREGEGLSQATFAKKLKISKSHLCDIEKGRKFVSPQRASEFAKQLHYPTTQFVRLALQDEINRAGLKLEVSVKAI